MKKHPNKDIRTAINYVISCDWRQTETGNSSHAFCRNLIYDYLFFYSSA